MRCADNSAWCFRTPNWRRAGLYENICGGIDLSQDKAWEAARQAGLDTDIQQMPMGMHTLVSEGFNTLSGGQRQRVMIARALARAPRILLFDEATSALDNRTQAIVAASLERLPITRLVIAHRLSTVRQADRIIMLSGGKVVQVGSYAELVARPWPVRGLRGAPAALKHDPEKCEAVFRKDHAQTKV